MVKYLKLSEVGYFRDVEVEKVQAEEKMRSIYWNCDKVSEAYANPEYQKAAAIAESITEKDIFTCRNLKEIDLLQYVINKWEEVKKFLKDEKKPLSWRTAKKSGGLFKIVFQEWRINPRKVLKLENLKKWPANSYDYIIELEREKTEEERKTLHDFCTTIEDLSPALAVKKIEATQKRLKENIKKLQQAIKDYNKMIKAQKKAVEAINAYKTLTDWSHADFSNLEKLNDNYKKLQALYLK